jgi:succinate dehydrogenase / fumarate reductase iron-sulfur subunit
MATDTEQRTATTNLPADKAAVLEDKGVLHPPPSSVGETVTLRVFRGDAEGGTEVEYVVPTFAGMVVLDAIHYIQHHTDTTLSCRWNCKAGKCGSCSAEINGQPRLLCKARVRDYAGSDNTILVHPLKAFPLVKDLVTDVSWNYRTSARIAPFTPRKDAPTPLRMQQIDVDRIQEFRKCIECFLCQDVCHVIRDHNRKDIFYGPRQMIKLANLDMHPYDGLDRREMVRQESGVGACNITKCCTEVCPEHIHITDNGIIPLKERVADIYFDPVMWLARKMSFQEGRGKPSASNFQPATEFGSAYPPPAEIDAAAAKPRKPLPRMEGGPEGVIKSEIEFNPENPNRARASVREE